MSSNRIIAQNSNSIINAINELMDKVPLDDLKTTYNAKMGTASITGHRNGVQYTTTLSKELNGVIQTSTMFNKNMGRDALAKQIKSLKHAGYNQVGIANMLGISQSTVSKYLRM